MSSDGEAVVVAALSPGAVISALLLRRMAFLQKVKMSLITAENVIA